MNFKITNPLVYIKAWWKKIMANEGAEFKIKIKPVTAIALAVVAFSLAFGLGGIVFPFAFPWLKLNTNNIILDDTASPTPVGEWKDIALKGTLKKTNSVPIKYFLLISSDEAVTLQAPSYISLDKLLDKRILATGTYNQKQKILIIQDVLDLEVLPTTPVPITTSTPSLQPTPIETPTAMPTLTTTSTVTAMNFASNEPSPTPIL